MSLLHITHCIDTEGPLCENFKDTFKRIEILFNLKFSKKFKNFNNLTKLQAQKINIKYKKEISKIISKDLLKYNTNLYQLKKMLMKILKKNFRDQVLDSFGNGWVYSWHCVDHINFYKNPRKKLYGYGRIFNFYKKILRLTKSNRDEINWHFHPKSILRKPLSNGTSYNNSMNELLEIICRRIIDDKWFPVVSRPGFHSIRPDSNLFLEQWLPFDYGNQSYEMKNNQKDLEFGRFGDWTRAPKNWTGYHPSVHDYQAKGCCKRTIYRSLNIGTRHSLLKPIHIKQAFRDAQKHGRAILCIVNHDYRDMTQDLINFKKLLTKVRKNFPSVQIKFSGSHEAAKNLTKKKDLPIHFKISLKKNHLIVIKTSKRNLFGPQPFLSIKTKKKKYFHDNFDIIIPKKKWSYIFDEHTIPLSQIKSIGVGSAGEFGNFFVKTLNLK
jgi:hypothetical protein